MCATGGGWDTGSRPEHLRRAVDASLQRLGVERIGLWQHHGPDPDIPFAETFGIVREIADSGTVAMVGLSNADPDQMRIARDIVGDAPVSVQNQLSLRFRTSLPEVAAHHPELATVADERGVSPQQIALAWELAQGSSVIPVPGAKRPASAPDSAPAADLALTRDDLDRLDAS